MITILYTTNAIAILLIIIVAIKLKKTKRLHKEIHNKYNTLEKTDFINKNTINFLENTLTKTKQQMADNASLHRQEKEVILLEAQAWKKNAEKDIREDANKRSRATLRGQATEHLAPYIMDGFNPKDFRFIGDPIDYLLCAGTGAIHDGKADEIESVILLDIKTGKAKLNKVQRRIRDAVLANKVKFMTYNTDTKILKEWK